MLLFLSANGIFVEESWDVEFPEHRFGSVEYFGAEHGFLYWKVALWHFSDWSFSVSAILQMTSLAFFALFHLFSGNRIIHIDILIPKVHLESQLLDFHLFLGNILLLCFGASVDRLKILFLFQEARRQKIINATTTFVNFRTALVEDVEWFIERRWVLFGEDAWKIITREFSEGISRSTRFNCFVIMHELIISF